MQRLSSVSVENATGKTKELFDTLQNAVGMVPNAARVMANSPAVLESYLAFSGAMNGASISQELHNLIKLSVSEANDCDYCTSIGCVVGEKSGLTADQLLEGRQGRSKDSSNDVALRFANSVLETKGKISEKELQKVKEAGFNDGQIVEIVSSVVLGCLTNFINNVADTELDIPAATPLKEHAMAGDSCSSGTCSA